MSRPGKTARIALLRAAVLAAALLLTGRFLARILVIYSLPVVYTHWRLSGWLAATRAKKVFSPLFIALAVAFPASEILAHAGGPGWLKIPLRVGYLTLPFLLYLFLAVLLLDLLLAANRLLKIVAPAKLEERRWRLRRAGLAFLLAAAVVAAGVANFRILRVSAFRIAVPAGASPLKALRIVMAADFHLGDLTAPGFMAEFADKVNALKPDLLLIPGDILEGDRADAATAGFERQFARIVTRYGAYASPGNHEAHGGGPGAGFYSRARICLLRDEALAIGGLFQLVGRSDPHGGGRLPLARLLRGRSRSLPLIVLDHRPDDIAEASRCGADIQVSGHSHHGQLFPLNIITTLQYPLSWGYRKIGATHFFVTSGVQIWGPRVRTAGVSEIMLIDVDFVAGGRRAPGPVLQ